MRRVVVEYCYGFSGNVMEKKDKLFKTLCWLSLIPYIGFLIVLFYGASKVRIVETYYMRGVMGLLPSCVYS